MPSGAGVRNNAPLRVAQRRAQAQPVMQNSTNGSSPASAYIFVSRLDASTKPHEIRSHVKTLTKDQVKIEQLTTKYDGYSFKLSVPMTCNHNIIQLCT